MEWRLLTNVDRISSEFLTGTKYCDVENVDIKRKAKQVLSSRECSDVDSAVRIFNWVRDEVKYAFGFWNVKASETMRKMSGMCANKANLQVAMLRAVGIPAGYGILRIRKEALRTVANEEIYGKSSDVIIHVYCRVQLNGRWISADSTVDRELYEAAYLKVPDWEYLSWDGRNNFQMSSSYVVEDLGLRANIDEYMDMPPRFLNEEIVGRANVHIERLRRQAYRSKWSDRQTMILL
jgi:transglutaminase-like putative cysteine protease